jgi:heterodisulfide reductase subunit C
LIVVILINKIQVLVLKYAGIWKQSFLRELQMKAEHSTKTLPNKRITPKQPLSSLVKNVSGFDPSYCYQCGKCSAGCPMAGEMDLKTHEIIRLLQIDHRDRLFASDAIWMCLTCETCTTRCPNEFDPAAVIDALREMTLKESPGGIPSRIYGFHAAFLDQIRTHGRVFEFGLVASYKLRGGPLFADIESVPAMLRRGKLSLVPKRIKDIKSIRRIFNKCATERSK